MERVRVRYRSFRSYSGPGIRGILLDKSQYENTNNHAQRALYLTEGVETGHRVGSIMAGDGTATTAGRGQHILVYPRELANEDFDARDDQGGLPKLLRKLEVETSSPALDKLYGAFIAEGWYVAQDGVLRWHDDARTKVKGRWLECKAGDIVHGAVLRDTITPKGGKVPRKGEQWEQAKRWALLFHEVFKEESSLKVQTDFELEHLVHRVMHRKYGFHPNRRRETVSQVVYGSRGFRGPAPVGRLVVGKHITVELDLAMCLFHSHTVNAPAIAYRKLKETLLATGYEPDHRNQLAEIAFAKELLKRLAKAKYAR